MKKVGRTSPIVWTIPFCVCAAALQLRADVTIRYQTTVKFASWAPPQVNALPLGQMPASSVRLKGGKAYSSNTDNTAYILDFTTQELTLLDTGRSLVSRMPLTGLPAVMTSIMPVMTAEAKKALEGFKATFDSKNTGRTDIIQGIQTEELDAVISMEMPPPQGAPQMSIGMKVVMHVWSAKAEEALRVQAIGQLSSYQQWGNYLGGLASVLQSSFAMMPGLRGAFTSMMETYSKTPVLRMQMEMYLPMPREVLQKLAEANPAGGPIDPNAPLMQMTYEAVEISSAPVDDSLFQVPPEYKTAEARDMLKGMVQKFSPAVQPPAVQTAAPPADAIPTRPGIYRVGAGVSAPQLTSKVEPKYTEEARNARVQGTAVLYIVVGTDGVPHDIRVVRSLSPDLDQKAIEAVSAWRFKPGEKEGTPVPVAAQIEVNFRLIDNPSTPHP